MTKKQIDIDPVTRGEVIDMALSDHVSFTAIKDLFGLNENQVKAIMRDSLRPARYEAWRARVQTFGERRLTYKHDAVSAKVDRSKPKLEALDEDKSDEAGSDKGKSHEGKIEVGEPFELTEPPIRKSAPSKRSLASHR